MPNVLPASDSQPRPPGRLFVISAPSGAGKTTISARLRESGLVRVSVSHTTRPPREGETHGAQYFFVSREEFLQMREADEFLEHAEVFGHLYGTVGKWVHKQLAKHVNILLEIDVQGARQVKQKMEAAELIFIRPPSLDALAERLKKRGKDSPETVARRLAAAEEEISHTDEYDHVIINDDLDRAVEDIRKIMQHQHRQV